MKIRTSTKRKLRDAKAKRKNSIAKKYSVVYKRYILSDTWKRKSRAAKYRVGYRCQVCNRSSDEDILDTHHRTYERLGYELDEDLIVLCRRCHGLYEKNKCI